MHTYIRTFVPSPYRAPLVDRDNNNTTTITTTPGNPPTTTNQPPPLSGSSPPTHYDCESTSPWIPSLRPSFSSLQKKQHTENNNKNQNNTSLPLFLYLSLSLSATSSIPKTTPSLSLSPSPLPSPEYRHVPRMDPRLAVQPRRDAARSAHAGAVHAGQAEPGRTASRRRGAQQHRRHRRLVLRTRKRDADAGRLRLHRGRAHPAGGLVPAVRGGEEAGSARVRGEGIVLEG
ncbi:uncharacterized protein J3D65DRAFT_615434 [Phyllosticta citribraziliensis]|uniref:Uncharacterized protein n=1 Tax=Phyllosticta citribraziliensis TaxID=989973 RepID=A0ABR1LZ28_9PEZI